MADDLSLLLRIRGDAAGAKAAAAETRAAIASLRQSTSSDFSAIQSVAKSTLSGIGTDLTNLAQRVPVVGGLFGRITENLKGLGEGTGKSTPAMNAFSRSVEDLAKTTGKSTSELTNFLKSFVTLPNEGARATAALQTFGGAATDLIPKLEKAGTQMATVATETATVGSAFAGLAGPLAIAAAGFIATGLAAGKLGTVLFGLAKAAADFQGKLFDMSQQTGVAVETLSALEVAALRVGGGIEGIVQPLIKFQGLLAEAQTSGSKAAELFKQLGVSTSDTEQALRKTLLALARMPEGFRQTATAQELFGRGARVFLAILKETGGDIDALIEKLRNQGLVTSQQAQRADEFNDQLLLLQVSLRGLGTEAIPLIIDVLKQLQSTIINNRDAFKALQIGVEALTSLFTKPLKGAIFLVTEAWKSHRTEIGLIIEAYQILKGAISDAVAEIPKQPITSAATSGIELLKELQRLGAGRQIAAPAQDFSKIKGLFLPTEAELARAQAEAQQRATRDVQLRQAELEESTQRHRRALERERDLDIRNTDEWEEESTRLLREHLSTQQAVFDQEQANINRFVQNAEDRLLAERELLQRRTKATKDFLDEVQRIEDEARRRRDQSALKVERQLAAIRETEREGELRRVEDALERQDIAESSAITRQLELLREAFADRKVLRDTELAQQTTSAERRTELINEQIEDEQRLTDETKRLIRERDEARNRSLLQPAPTIPRTGGNVLSPEQIKALGEVPDQPIRNLADAFEELGVTMSDTFGISREAGAEFSDTLSSTLTDMAFAIGDLVNQWVLLGTTGPNAMRKLTASVLAGLAAQAAVKAIFQLAEGFAALFFNPAQAAAHFKSAALFGAVAVAAGAAGRAIAGNAFAPTAGGGAAGVGGGGQLNPLTLNRNQPEPRRIIVEFRADDSRFGQAITAHVVRDITNAGPIREAYNNDSNI